MPSIVYHLIFYLLSLSSVMASSSSIDSKKRERPSLKQVLSPKYVRTLLRCGTKTGMCTALSTLQEAGLLETGDSVRKMRRMLEDATVQHGREVTPYGTVIQQVDLRIPGIAPWEYCHPLAYLRYVSGLNNAFGEVMQSCIEPGKPLTVILYMDELCPGNPFRPEKGRKLVGIYWCILEWPDWILRRSAMWPVLGVILSATVESMEGGISAFYARILELCFTDGAHTMLNGVQLVCNGKAFSVTFAYGGLLADEDCLKKVHGYKGAQGTKPCMDCANLMNVQNRALVPAGAVHISTSTLEGIEFNKNEDIWEIADVLQESVDRRQNIKKMETSRGVKYVPHGLLFNIALRKIHRPIDHYLRDWMHMLVSNGTANAQTHALGKALKKVKVPTSVLQTYSTEYTLPAKYGKVSKEWTVAARFSGTDFSSFASPMLTLAPIIGAFLVDHMAPLGGFEPHIECWLLLVDILGFLTCGSTHAMQNIDLLVDSIAKHHKLYDELYPSTIKPKWHHMLHLPSQYAAMKKIISCFVTERKHRSLKRAALYVFRYLEHTSLADLVTQQCEQILDGRSLFQREFLVHPSTIEVRGQSIQRASAACLECGNIHARDIVYVKGGQLARVTGFWQYEAGLLTDQCTESEKVGEHTYRDSAAVVFVASHTIIGAVAYRGKDDGELRVLLPFIARFH